MVPTATPAPDNLAELLDKTGICRAADDKVTAGGLVCDKLSASGGR
jgi:hypothetical protein